MKKNYIIIAILGTLWGVVETQLGSLLHAADLPFTGLLMMSIGIMFQTMARQTTLLRGSAVLMGIVAIFIKLLIVGGIAVATAVAIAVESLIIELIYRRRSPTRLRMAIAGAAGVAYALFHPFLSMPLFMGLTPYDAFQRLVKGGSALFGLHPHSGLVILLLLLLLHLICGFVAALMTHGFIARLQQRGLMPLPPRKSS